MARQAERREATRGSLIAAARAAFSRHGYDATSTEMVLARAGLSKGAMYHHFESKAELMAAVFAAVSRDVMAEAQAAAGEGRSRADLGRALKAWLRAVLTPEARRIILETGPAVLGLARAREIEETITQAPMRRTIEQAVAAGAMRCDDPDLAARLLAAAAAELALAAIQRGLTDSQLEPLDAQLDALVAALV